MVGWQVATIGGAGETAAKAIVTPSCRDGTGEARKAIPGAGNYDSLVLTTVTSLMPGFHPVCFGVQF